MKKPHFRIWNETTKEMNKFSTDGVETGIMICLGITDKNGDYICEKDIVQISGTDTIIEISNYAEFLLYCGEYKGKNGIDLHPLLTIIGNTFEGTRDDRIKEDDSKIS